MRTGTLVLIGVGAVAVSVAVVYAMRQRPTPVQASPGGRPSQGVRLGSLDLSGVASIVHDASSIVSAFGGAGKPTTPGQLTGARNYLDHSSIVDEQ